MNLSKQEALDKITEITAIHALHEEAVKTAKLLSKEWKKQVERTIKPYFPQVVVYDADCGCASSGWKPSIRMRSHYHVRGETFHYLGAKKFVWVKGWDSRALSHKVTTNRTPLFDIEKVISLCEQLTEELGIPVYFYESKLEVEFNDTPRNCDDLLLIHKGGEIVASGKIKYVGWDCIDQWAIVRDDTGKHLYYGTTAHGGGMNCHVLPGGDYSKFFKMAGEEDTVVIGENVARGNLGMVL